MIKFFKHIVSTIIGFFTRVRLYFLFQFKLKPKIVRMTSYVTRIALLKRDIFPEGKSIFVFKGKDDYLYFVMYKEADYIGVTEVYDDILNKLPERYNLLKRIQLNDLLPIAPTH